MTPTLVKVVPMLRELTKAMPASASGSDQGTGVLFGIDSAWLGQKR